MHTAASHSHKRQAYAAIAYAVITVIACAGLMAAAMLGPAPLPVVPLAVLICIGCPVAMVWPVPRSIHALRAPPVLPPIEGEQALKAFRSHLARLPEREHPLGL